MLRLVFMGSDAIALPALEWLAPTGSGLAGEACPPGRGRDIARLIAVFTQPDRPVGRGQKVAPNAIKQWALAHNLPVFQPEKLTADTQRQLAGLGADLVLVMAYGHILKDDFIATPRLGCLNLHASLLPKYRGASPIQAAIACGERQTGVTLMRIVQKLDAGPAADAERVPIGPLDTAAEVGAKLAQACVPLLARALPRLAAGTLAFTPQDDTQATYCRKLTKEDAALDFSAPAAVLASRINGLAPWPGCAVRIDSQPVKLGLADTSSLIDYKPAGAGVVLGQDTEGLLIGTGQGALRLRKLQRPGGKMLPVPEFLRGWPITPGTQLPSRPMSPLISSQPFS